MKFLDEEGDLFTDQTHLGVSSLIEGAKLLRKDLGISHLETVPLNQDSLELLFSKIRQMGGCGTNPSVDKFRYIFVNLCNRMNLKKELKTVRRSNVDYRS